MKVRIGYGAAAGGAAPNQDDFSELVDGLERNGFDSLWLSERVAARSADPLIGLAVAAGRTRRLKLGTSVLVLPGRNPVLLAKEMATLDVLSGGRFLPAFGLGVAEAAEQQAFGVGRGERAAWFDEALPLVRRLWSEDGVDHHGPRFHLQGVTVRPKPLQHPPEVWLGGAARSELRRAGRLGDGWLPSFCTPEEASAGRQVVEAAAEEASRSIDPEHFGALVVYAVGEPPERLLAAVAARRPGVDPAEIVAIGLHGLHRRLERFIELGFSKLVVVPVTASRGGSFELDELADAVLGLTS